MMHNCGIANSYYVVFHPLHNNVAKSLSVVTVHMRTLVGLVIHSVYYSN